VVHLVVHLVELGVLVVIAVQLASVYDIEPLFVCCPVVFSDCFHKPTTFLNTSHCNHTYTSYIASILSHIIPRHLLLLFLLLFLLLVLLVLVLALALVLLLPLPLLPPLRLPPVPLLLFTSLLKHVAKVMDKSLGTQGRSKKSV